VDAEEEATMDRGVSRLRTGMTVRGADAHRVGTIKDVHEREIPIQRRLQPTVHVPLKAFVPLIAAVLYNPARDLAAL
jgi:hypothetical protein